MFAASSSLFPPSRSRPLSFDCFFHDERSQFYTVREKYLSAASRLYWLVGLQLLRPQASGSVLRGVCVIERRSHQGESLSTSLQSSLAHFLHGNIKGLIKPFSPSHVHHHRVVPVGEINGQIAEKCLVGNSSTTSHSVAVTAELNFSFFLRFFVSALSSLFKGLTLLLHQVTWLSIRSSAVFSSL